MTDIEQCQLPQGHQRHRWFACGQEVKCPGLPSPSATTTTEPASPLPDAKGHPKAMTTSEPAPPSSPVAYHPDPEINAEIAAESLDAERADLAAGYAPRRWECPDCGASHGRGHFQTIGTHRCLRCGYVGTGGVMFGTFNPTPPAQRLSDDPAQSAATDAGRAADAPGPLPPPTYSFGSGRRCDDTQGDRL